MRIFTLPRMAAAIAFLILSSIVYFQFRPAKSKLTQIAGRDAKPEKAVIVHGGNKAILTLADGTKVVLGDSSLNLPSQDGIKIVKTDGGELLYTPEPAVNGNPTNKFNVLETPKGGIFQVNLPDGTKVWLNSASVLKYPLAFTANERRVELEGEAYFEVAHNANKPFRVISNNQSIEVLGTHFNVSSYLDDRFSKTTLLEGSVKVRASSSGSTALLRPGEQATNSSDLSALVIKKVDVENAVAWKSGLFRFDNEDIQSIMTKLGRWYDVEVVYKNELNDVRFGGSVSRFADIEKVLRKLELTNTIHFKIEGRRIIVMK